mgnify:FL=1
MNYAYLSEALEARVVAEFDRQYTAEKRSIPEDTSYFGMLIGDAGRMVSVCESINRGNLAEAARRIRAMDTAPREQFCRYMDETLGSAFTDYVLS